MDTLEKKILKTVSDNLKRSLNSGFTIGNIDDWANWAKKMKNSITDATSMLNELIKEEE